jgi:2,3-bisphosphoglycerate-independent phosphoglycerate mutase
MRVPSQFVAHHDEKPEMRARAITDEVVRRVKSKTHDVFVINFANADMVGHTGNLKATVKSIEHVDECLARLAEEVRSVGGTLVIVGDHGNAERKLNLETGETITEHTDNPVPFIVVNEKLRKGKLGDGMLADVAPTILEIMDVPKPPAMTGFSLLRT